MQGEEVAAGEFFLARAVGLCYEAASAIPATEPSCESSPLPLPLIWTKALSAGRDAGSDGPPRYPQGHVGSNTTIVSGAPGGSAACR
jgi:hypothetical protein